MFHRIRILLYNFEDYVDKKPLSKKKINECVDWLYEYVKTKNYQQKQIENKIQIKENHLNMKINLENLLLEFGMNNRLFEVKEGSGKRKKYTVEEVRGVIGNKLFDNYFTCMLKLLTYSLKKDYIEDIQNHNKLLFIVNEYGIKKEQIKDCEKINFIYYD